MRPHLYNCILFSVFVSACGGAESSEKRPISAQAPEVFMGDGHAVKIMRLPAKNSIPDKLSSLQEANIDRTNKKDFSDYMSGDGVGELKVSIDVEQRSGNNVIRAWLTNNGALSYLSYAGVAQGNMTNIQCIKLDIPSIKFENSECQKRVNQIFGMLTNG